MERNDHSMTRQLATALCLLAVSSPSAVAQEVTDAEWSGAVDALEAGNYPRAADLLSEFYRREESVRTACNLALAYDRWGAHQDKAIAAYENCARLDASGRYHQHALDRASALREEIAAQQTSPPPAEATPPAPANTAPPQPAFAREPARIDSHAEPSRVLLWVGIATAVAGGVLLGVGGGVAQSGQSDLDEISVMPGTADSPAPLVDGTADARRYREADSKRSVALGLYVAGGVIAAVGVALAAVDLVRSSRHDVALAPTPDGLAAAYRHHF